MASLKEMLVKVLIKLRFLANLEGCERKANRPMPSRCVAMLSIIQFIKDGLQQPAKCHATPANEPDAERSAAEHRRSAADAEDQCPDAEQQLPVGKTRSAEDYNRTADDGEDRGRGGAGGRSI